MNASNLDFKTAYHAEVYVSQREADVIEKLTMYSDSQLRAMIVWRRQQPQMEQQMVALVMERELWRRLEVKEMEGD